MNFGEFLGNLFCSTPPSNHLSYDVVVVAVVVFVVVVFLFVDISSSND